MWNRCRPTRASFWSAWKSRMSTRSTASRRRSRSGRRTPRAIRARPSRPQPSCTISCACCGRARAARTARTAAVHVERDSVDQVAAKMLAQPEGSRWYALFPIAGGEELPTRCATACSICARKASTGCFRTAQMFEFSTPESLLDVDFSKPVFILVDRLAISPDMRQRLVDTVEICYRESGEVIFEPAAAAAQPLRFNEKFACKLCGKEFRRAGAEPVQLQQSLRRLQALPGLRQHHRLRPGSGDSGSNRCRLQRARWIRGPSRSIPGIWRRFPARRARARFA